MKKTRIVDLFIEGGHELILKKMKLTFFFAFLVFVTSWANSFSQATRLNLKLENVVVQELLQTIEDQTDYFFLYQDEVFVEGQRVTIHSSNETIESVLDQLAKQAGITYEISERQIVLKEKAGGEKGITQPQKKTVSGYVFSSSGEPVPGVTVIVKGTTTGTVTDIDGKFTMTNIAAEDVLVFSFVGMKTEEIAVGGQSVINITMEEEAIGLQEVVAVGYGTQKKVNLTGAVSVMSSEALENRPIATTAEGLQGIIPNLNVNFESGNPAENAVDYNIRGFESINGGSPYILVDGVPMGIESINPNDIESISVLKDASASAIYGGKAAFGVILVTTKNAKGKDKITVKYSSETALSRPMLQGFDPVDNSYDYVTYKNLMYANDGAGTYYDDVRVAGIKAYYENPGSAPQYAIVNGNFEWYGFTNFEEELIRNASPSYKNNITVTGGTGKTSFFVSAGNYTKEGILKVGNDVYSRNNILIKLNQNITDWISFDQKVAMNMIRTDQPHDYGANNIGPAAVHLLNPTMPILFPKIAGLEHLEGKHFENVIGYLAEGSRTVNRSYDTWLTAGMNLKPIKNLNIRSEVSYNYRNTYNNDAVTSIEFVKTTGAASDSPYTYGYTNPTSASMTMSLSRGYIFNTYAEYELNNIGVHYLKAMVGFNQEYRFWDRVGGTGKQLITNAVPHIGATLGEKTLGASSDVYSLRGGFYRLNYIYNDKYMLELSGRYDGTSRFPKEDRYGFFPSGSIGWRISEEGFMAGIDWIDNLKIRVSYGELGNQSISFDGQQQYHPYLSTMGIANAHWYVLDAGDSKPDYTTSPLLVSKTLTWETVATQDLGVDFTMFNQRLDGSFDYYIRTTKDMLLKKTYPQILSAIPPYENGADLETKGWEFTVGWRDKINQDWSYGVRFSMWDAKSTITKFYNPLNSFANYYEGEEIGEIWGYETGGIIQNEADVAAMADQSKINNGIWSPGDIWYVDQLTVDTDGDGVPDATDGEINSGDNTLDNHGDMIKIGNRTPRYSYSFSLDVDYKNWGLTAFFQGIGKKDYLPNVNFEGWYPWAVNGTIKKSDITDSWTVDNTDAYWTAASADDRKNQSSQTRWLQDASYLRLKSLVLNYRLPSNLISKVGLSKADVFLSGQNLWEISNFIYNRDPEANIGNALNPFSQTNGPNHINYPSQRTISIGVNLTF